MSTTKTRTEEPTVTGAEAEPEATTALDEEASEQRTYLLKITGVTPLIVHNSDSMIDADPELDKGSDKAAWEKAHIENYLYRNTANELILPAKCLRRAFSDSCKFMTTRPQGLMRSWGPLVQSATIFPEDLVLRPNKWKPFGAVVVVGGRRIIRWRPRFEAWGGEATVVCFDAQLKLHVIQDLVNRTGAYVGLGTGRRIGFGRARIEVTE
jgi:hypothetical protein